MQTLKSLFVTLLILGGAFLAYDYYQAPHKDKLVFKDSPYPPKPVAPVKQAPPTPSESSAAIAKAAPLPDAPVTRTTAPATPKAAAPAEPVKKAGDFVPPAIPDAARVTQEWRAIPPTAFPRTVTLKAPVAFKGNFGTSQVAAGAQVVVLSAQNGILTVTPATGSPLRAFTPIDSTDLKVILNTAYDSWRAKRIEEARIAWKNRKVAAGPADESGYVGADGKPQMAPDGTYPLLLASMNAGQVTEVTPTSIKRWGTPEPGTHKGQPCWIIPVDFDAQTAFGKISSVAMAKVVGGKVAGWFYKGSEEVVP